MANHTYSKGLLYKKTLNSSGEVTGSVPLLLKTLGSLVIMSDGTDAETAISTAISNMVTPDETTIVTGQDGITISVKKSTSAEIDEILGDVPTEHTWEGYYTKSEVNGLVNAVDAKFNQNDIETALGYTPIASSTKGSANGVASLDANGLVPSAQLPSYVDDVIESATFAALPATGETGKIYVTLNDNKTYRWSGSAYVEISQSLALGETSSTAFAGDKGKTAYEHSQATHARTDATNVAIVSGKLNINGTATNIGDFKAVSTAASQGLTDTEKANALANIGAVPNSDLIGIVDNGAKNLLHFEDSNTVIGNFGGFLINGLNAITVFGKAAWAKSVTSVPLSPDTYELIFTIDSTDVNMCIDIHNESNNTNYYHEAFTATGTIAREFTIPSGVSPDVITFRVCCNNSSTAQTDTVTSKISNVMICTKAHFNISSAYEPYALGNQYLTPELIELCDSGAKNIVDLSATGTGTHNTVTFTNLGNNRYKINGTPSASDTHLDIMGTWSSVPSFLSNNVGKTIVFTTNQDYIYYGIIPIVGGSALEYVGGNKSTPVAYTIPNNLSGALLRIYVDTNQTYSNVTAELLVCTKAAFGVSSKFVPYRLNYDLVCQNIKDVNTVLEAVL